MILGPRNGDTEKERECSKGEDIENCIQDVPVKHVLVCSFE